MIHTAKAYLARRPHWGFALAAAAALAVMLITCVRIWSPAYGLTRFIPIGTEFTQRGIAPYRTAPKYLDPQTRWGFDGQLYAEMSLDPLLRDPQLKTALDDPPYRAHRIFLSWLAWAGGLGRPAWVLNAYAALNPLFWLGYAVILFVLFRPYGWAGVAGFAAMLLTCGVIESTDRALTDFPAFVLMTLAAMISGWGGVGVMALAALTREVNILGLLGWLELRPPWGRALRKNLLIALIGGVPLLLWFAYVGWRMKMKASMAGGNLDWPLRAIAERLIEGAAAIRRGGFSWSDLCKAPTELHALLTVVATLTQCAYVLTHPKWENRLWRIGAIFVLFFVCISSNVWGGGAYFTVTRHALPITLAFNLVLAMRPRRSWLLWFILGNCFVPAGICEFIRFGQEIPHRAEYLVAATPALEGKIAVRYGSGWAGPERDAHRAWRWALEQEATLVLHNASGKPVGVRFDFHGRSLVPRDLTISPPGRILWTGALDPQNPLAPVRTPEFTIPAGDTPISFSSRQPAAPTPSRDPRRLTFMVSDLLITVVPAP